MKNGIISLIQSFSFYLSYFLKNGFSENKFLKKIISSEAIIVDVGSNLGTYIKNIENINQNTKIYSIEPNLQLMNYQKNRFKKNKNIIFSNLAIDSKDGIRKLYIRNPASHSSFFKTHQDEQFNKIVGTVDVQACTLEQYFIDQNINKITLLKIDIEGHDYEVLSSIKYLLVNSKIDFIKIEANQKYLQKIMNLAFESNLEFIGISNSFYYKNDFVFMDIYFENKNSGK